MAPLHRREQKLEASCYYSDGLQPTCDGHRAQRPCYCFLRDLHGLGFYLHSLLRRGALRARTPRGGALGIHQRKLSEFGG